MLEDDEDILTQISAQLDIPSISAPGCHPGTSLLPPLEGLESGMLDDMVMEDLEQNETMIFEASMSNLNDSMLF